MSDQQISQIMRALGRIEGILERVVPLVDSHEKSIDSLNGAENIRKGISATISLVVSAGVNLISSLWRIK